MDDKEIARLFASSMNGTNMLLYHLLNVLDANGTISKKRMADVIETELAVAEADAPPNERTRLDFIMMRNLVKLLRDPKPPSGKLPALN
jgi:hypothetical protein